MARTIHERDEAYVIDLCDEIMGCSAARQHRFPFRLGDPGKNGRQRTLPVDAYYAQARIVVEYRERQHFESLPIFDRRMTVSGIRRGQQRALYDQRRRELLPAHELRLVEICYSELVHDRHRRLRRERSKDMLVLRARLASALGDTHSGSV